MGSRTFASLVPRVQASVPGCPNPTVVQYIRDAAIRTCERTLYWRYQVPLYNLLPGVSEYAYNKPVDADVHAVFEAILNGYPLDRMTLDEALVRYPQWADLYSGVDPAVVWVDTPANVYNIDPYNGVQFNEGGGVTPPATALVDASTPRAICQITPDRYVILPLPDAARTYQMRMFVALKPKRNATQMDEYIMDELEEVIMHGALQHLLVLPEQPWTDRELAAYHTKQYIFQTAERRARANLGNMRGTLRVQMVAFGA